MSADTLDKTDSLADVEADFAKPCIAPDCENEATWAVWGAHGPKTCPLDAYACDKHKEWMENYWKHLSTCGKHTCARCMVRIEIDDLSKYFRAIKL